MVENFLIYTQIELLGSDPQRVAALRKKQSLIPRKVVETRAQHQAEVCGRKNDLTMDLMDKPVAISEEYLTKIVDELTHNALKFSKPGTPIQVLLFPSDRHLTMSISDRGRGLHTDQIRKVGAYMQFDRKQHEQQGLGLGLTIAKRLTELHGGNLTLQSQQGVGTTVVVKLPLA